MGIKDLWTVSSINMFPHSVDIPSHQLVQLVGEKASIHHVSVDSGFNRNPGGARGLRLGVDAP